ncbi:Bacterial alpha-L-rhamnosidase [Mucilaginibacter pallidiroseus]|uniref:alpha-L-rhamnosidase n=1 Tax=Mucilaginibacter pallidiroseus TaxID=2599295 RepID=A0A563UI92_9SPHI|nr:glycoside hydrolase family 78 protein [Mucilaginibacter pallidiroseus]TWR31120.1 Bacterial alpha-L-rhamnosidase [Mucilaginibacter pallidiroseus]
MRFTCFNQNRLAFAITLIASVLFTGNIASAQTGATLLKCEHLNSPMGVDEMHPRLSWQMNDRHQGAAQTAYAIIVSKDSMQFSSGPAVVWNSGRVRSSASLVNYSGKALEPFTRYYWKVRTWDNKGALLTDSKTAWFETGMMDMGNWTGAWISDGGSIAKLQAPYFRKKFNAGKKIRSARAYIAVAGLYELFINGHKIGNHRLDPMYTRFDRRNLYVTYDVTNQLQNGDNAIGVVLGNGWYNHQSLAVWNFDRAPWRQRPTFCLDLKITYEDGTSQTIYTDESWKTHSGPIVFNSIYTGEHYDSRQEIPGWNTANFDDSKWNGTSFRAAPSKKIVSQVMVPIRNVEEIAPKSVVKFSDSNYVVDLGRNIAGVTKVRLNGDSGTVVRLTHGERLFTKDPAKKGHVDMSNIDVYYRPKDNTDPYQTDVVILNGKCPVEFMPSFNYKGFQYVEVRSNKPIKFEKEDIKGYFMHSDVDQVGRLSSSNPLVDNLWRATNASYLSNLMGYPTDCPQREKNGWTGDGHFAVETGLFNFDGISVYEKWLADHRDEQQPNGVLPDIIPTGGWGYGDANGTDWTSTVAIIPWNLYMFYGDSKALKDNYSNIKAYVNYVNKISPTGLTTFGRGDWVPVKTSSSLEYTSSIYFYVDANILAKAAKLFGNKKDELYYSQLASKIKKAINYKYFDKAAINYDKGTQTEMSMALLWNIVPDQYRLKLAENLAKRVAQDNMHIDVGVLGAKAILNALSENGQAETAYKLASQDTYPSWGWWIVNGATTLYENWDIDAARDISLNHMMFGEIGGWFFKGLGGIKADERQPGFKNILLKPNFVSGLDFFNSNHVGPYGPITSSWRRVNGKVMYDVVVPANSSADVSFPTGTKKVILSGKNITAAKAYHVLAGSYRFEIE